MDKNPLSVGPFFEVLSSNLAETYRGYAPASNTYHSGPDLTENLPTIYAARWAAGRDHYNNDIRQSAL